MTADVVSAVRRETVGMPANEAFEYALGVIKDQNPPSLAIVKWRDRIPSITGQQAVILELLWKARPEMVSQKAIYDALYAGRYDAFPNDQIIYVQLCKLRKKLPAGVTITNIKNFGYALTGYDIWEDQVAET